MQIFYTSDHAYTTKQKDVKIHTLKTIYTIMIRTDVMYSTTATTWKQSVGVIRFSGREEQEYLSIKKYSFVKYLFRWLLIKARHNCKNNLENIAANLRVLVNRIYKSAFTVNFFLFGRRDDSCCSRTMLKETVHFLELYGV